MRRIGTNWYAGTGIKVTEATAIMGNSRFAVPIYAQQGSIIESTNVVFVVDGQQRECSLGSRQTGTIQRLFRLEGTNVVFLSAD